MFQKKRIIFILPFFLFLLAASTLFLPETEEPFFSSEEMIVLREGLDLIDLRIGYDYSIKLNFITYQDGFSEQNFNLKKSQLFMVLQKRDINLLNAIYIKVYQLFISTEHEMKKFQTSDVERFEKIRTTYLPPLKRYMELLKVHIISRNPSLRSSIDEGEKKILRKIERYYREQEEIVYSFFTENELSILKRTTQALDFDYGYDDEIELAYIFSFAHSEKNFEQKEKDFSKIIEQLEIKSLLSFHNKIYRLFSMTAYKMEIYRKRKDWRYYIYIKNDLFPPLKKYYNLVEKSVIQRNTSIKGTLEKDKKEIEKWVKWYYDDSEGIIDTF